MKDQRPDDRDVDRIRAQLDRAAPQDSRVLRRADAVVRRGRRGRTRNGVIGAVAVGVAAAAVIVGPQFVDSSPVTNEATDPSNGVATRPTDTVLTGTPTNTPPTNEPVVSHPDPYLAHPCPLSPVEVPDVSDTAAVTLGPDAATIRLCRASVPGFSSVWDPPADALVVGADDFAAQVAELPDADPDPCPTARPTPQPFALQITDSAGATQTLGSAFTACGVVTVNGRLVSAEDLLDAFRQALAAQRQRFGGEFEPQDGDLPPLECRDADPPIRPGWMSEITAETRFVAAITCQPWRHPTDRGELLPATRASAAAIDLLNQEWAANARDLTTLEPIDVDRCPTMDLIPLPTYVMTTWGDVVRMPMAACGDYRIGLFQLVMSNELLDALSLPYQPGS